MAPLHRTRQQLSLPTRSPPHFTTPIPLPSPASPTHHQYSHKSHKHQSPLFPSLFPYSFPYSFPRQRPIPSSTSLFLLSFSAHFHTSSLLRRSAHGPVELRGNIPPPTCLTHPSKPYSIPTPPRTSTQYALYIVLRLVPWNCAATIHHQPASYTPPSHIPPPPPPRTSTQHALYIVLRLVPWNCAGRRHREHADIVLRHPKNTRTSRHLPKRHAPNTQESQS